MSLEKKSLLDNRYHLLATSSIYTYDDENLTSYADFLRSVLRFFVSSYFVLALLLLFLVIIGSLDDMLERMASSILRSQSIVPV